MSKKVQLKLRPHTGKCFKQWNSKCQLSYRYAVCRLIIDPYAHRLINLTADFCELVCF